MVVSHCQTSSLTTCSLQHGRLHVHHSMVPEASSRGGLPLANAALSKFTLKRPSVRSSGPARTHCSREEQRPPERIARGCALSLPHISLTIRQLQMTENSDEQSVGTRCSTEEQRSTSALLAAVAPPDAASAAASGRSPRGTCCCCCCCCSAVPPGRGEPAAKASAAEGPPVRADRDRFVGVSASASSSFSVRTPVVPNTCARTRVEVNKLPLVVDTLNSHVLP